MSRLARTLALGSAALALPVALVATSFALPLGPAARVPGGSTGSPVLERAAAGPVDQYGGARRLAGDQTRRIADAVRGLGAKNVILVIGDGMGDSELTIARNYLEGAGGFLRGLDALPMTGQMTHYSVDRASGLPDYAADSSATATAWATGVKTYDGAVGVDRHGRPHQTVLEWARRWGRATGNVTTSDVQDATPAALYAHVPSRACKGPESTSRSCPAEALESGGRGSITEQLLEARPDVTLGGGAAYFAEAARAGRWQGRTLAEQARARGFQYLTDPAALDGVRRADQTAPVLGLFSPGAMPVRFAPLVATRGGAALPAARCTPNPAFAQVPSLARMTGKAIELLSTSAHGRRNGFFLQVESASIDKSDHAADACGQIGETEQLDEAVQAALEFARRDRNTLVVVTADHAHTSQVVGAGTPGHDVRLRTADGADMLVTYGTGPLPGAMQHTGTQLRVAGYGPAAANVVGLIDQTDLFFVMRDSMSAWAGPRSPVPYRLR